jgi:hypothetical protein
MVPGYRRAVDLLQARQQRDQAQQARLEEAQARQTGERPSPPQERQACVDFVAGGRAEGCLGRCPAQACIARCVQQQTLCTNASGGDPTGGCARRGNACTTQCGGGACLQRCFQLSEECNG